MEDLSLEKEQIDSSVLRTKNKPYFKFIFYVIFFLVFLFIVYFFMFSAPKNFPINKNITIEEGSSLRGISKTLKDNNVIKSRVVFETLIIMYGNERHINPGDYIFSNKLSSFEVAHEISLKVSNPVSIRVTIPEGFSNTEIAELFSKKLKKFDSNKFLENNKEKQGYLFPDTYLFFSIADENDVSKQMESNFNRKIKNIKSDLEKTEKTQEEIIIMASLIEREASGDIDREIISGILWNRISKNMPLQVDAYMETYKKKGLPNMPICNPGLEAIKAAIYPASSKYLYYLHDKNGLIHFASSFSEHKKNIQKYLK